MLTDSEILNQKKTALLKLRKAMTSIVLETSRHVGELAQQMDPKRIRAFLRTECGLPSQELTTYLGFAAKLGHNMESLEGRYMSFPLARALVAADEHTRREAVTLIETGANLDVQDVKLIARRIDEARFQTEELEHIRRRKRVARMANANLRQLKAEVERGIGDLLVDVENFIDVEIPHPAEHWEASPQRPEYLTAVGFHAELSRFFHREVSHL